MPENWMPPEFGPWLLWGDLADDRHPNFCLNAADAMEGASVGSNTSMVSVLDQPSTVTTGNSGTYSRRRQRAQELEEKFKLLNQDAKSDQGALGMLQGHMKMTKNFMEAHMAKNADDKTKALIDAEVANTKTLFELDVDDSDAKADYKAALNKQKEYIKAEQKKMRDDAREAEEERVEEGEELNPLNMSAISINNKRQRLGAAEASLDDEDDSNRNGEHCAEYLA